MRFKFFSFWKAFDTVDQKILCKKLECCGIRGRILSWIKSYLSDWYQYVKISGIKSPKSKVLKGVLQGSIFGPLLFILYINDMDKCFDLKLVHSADDIKPMMLEVIWKPLLTK